MAEGGGSNQADVARKGLVSLNRLDYVLQPDLSVVTARTNKRHFFQQTSYTPSTRAICILNSGAEYIDPQNSYLMFTVGVSKTGTTANELFAPNPNTGNTNIATAPYPVSLGAGSAINFIKRAILTSRSGDEIERVDEVGQLAPLLDRYMHSDNWLSTHGNVIGYNSTYVDGLAGFTTANLGYQFPFAPPVTSPNIPDSRTTDSSTNNHTFIIPIGCIFGLFRSFDRLLPSMLMSGLRIEIEWESAGNALMLGTDNGTVKNVTLNYEITQPEIVLDSYTLTDSIQRVLNEESAIRGLELVYTSFYYHSAQPKTLSDSKQVMNIEVRKAVSRALGVLHKIRPQAKTVGFPHVDYYRSKAAQNSSYQLRLGSLYFPHQPILGKGGVGGNLLELYWHTQHGFGKIKTPSAPTSVMAYSENSVPVLTVADSVPNPQSLATFARGMAAVYTDLERSTTQRLTGIPVNNSRVAELQIEDILPDRSAATEYKISGWTVDVWLHYVRLARVFLQNVEIEE